MSAWRTAPLGFNSPSLEAILRQIEYLTRNTSEGLAPAVEAVEAAGFREAFRTVRMTRGDPAAEDPRGLWALGGLEKG